MFYLNKYYDNIVEISFSKIRLKYYPNMVIYGVNDFGKEYYLSNILKKIYPGKNLSTSIEEYDMDGYGNTTKKLELEQSNYHLIFKPNSNGMDKYILQKIIKDLCKIPLAENISGDKLLRTIVINKIDDLNYYAQASLRRNMEKYVSTTRFILISDNLSKVSETIRSRCSLIRIPYNSEEQNRKILDLVCEGEGIKKSIIDDIIGSNMDIKQLLWKLYLRRNGVVDRLELNDYLRNLVECMNKLIKKYSDKEYKKMCVLIHQIYISNFKIENILIELLNNILEMELSLDKKYDISKIFVDYNYRINNGKRMIIHIESLILDIMSKIIE